jgi:flagellar biosynthesis protein FlhA
MNFTRRLSELAERYRIAMPLFLMAIMSMVILPLPPLVLDVLFTFNIVLALIVILVSVSSRRPLDFSVFPTIILATTLMRLSLNVASTRVVLLHGHEGHSAAGRVIEAFGNVVIGGNFVVGLVVFVILMVVNFIVVTKGAERISEVSARFTPCPASRWPSTPTSTPASSTRKRRRSGAAMSASKPTSTARWMAPPSSCVATPSPAS